MNNPSFQINPALTIEDFGQEIILVNLRNGAYFSLKGPAASVWRELSASSGEEDMLGRLENQFAFDDQALSHLSKLLAQFRDDELIAFPESFLSSVSTFTPRSKSSDAPFSLPLYDKFTDVQDILLLDPIHDVGELGWPHPKD